MSEILTERSGSILRIQFNRPARKNAMTSSMYVTMAELLNAAVKDDQVNAVLWHGSGDSFCAGNDLEDFIKNPPGPGESPQSRLERALTNFDKPLVVAVHGAAIGGGTTMLTHCDFVFAGESTKFQLPFINLGLVPEFGSSCSIPARIGYLHAAELFLLGQPFDAKRAAELGLVTRVVPDATLLAKLPAAFVHAIRLALSDTLHDIYLFAGLILVVALISTVFMKEVPLTGDRAENGFDEAPVIVDEEEREQARVTA